MDIKDYPFGEVRIVEDPKYVRQGVDPSYLVSHCLTVGEGGFEDEDAAIDFMKNNEYYVSCNDIICTDGTLIHFADKGMRTNHAGKSLHGMFSKENGYTCLNKYAYGIELIRKGDEEKTKQYTPEEYNGLAWMHKFYLGMKYDQMVTHEHIRWNYINQYNLQRINDSTYKDINGKNLPVKTDPDNFDLEFYNLVYQTMTENGQIPLINIPKT